MATPGNKHTVQNILNWSFDETFKTIAISLLGYDGVSMQRMPADALAVIIQTSGTDTFIGTAAPGTLAATAKWQAIKVDTTGTVTHADGNADYDNIATDLTSLTYS